MNKYVDIAIGFDEMKIKAEAFDIISEYIIDYGDCICIDSLFYDEEAQAIREALNNE